MKEVREWESKLSVDGPHCIFLVVRSYGVGVCYLYVA
jgi:hypothetical protein